MKNSKFFILSFLFIFCVISGFAFTPQSDINMRNFYSMFNATDVCVTGDICLADSATQTYVDAQNIIYNDSMKIYVDSQDIVYNDSMTSYVDSQDVIYNNSMKTYVDSQNASMTSYVDAQDVIYNDSMVVYVNAQDGIFNDSIASYVDSQDTLFNSSMKTYVDAQDVTFNNSMKSYVDTSFILISSESDLNVNSSLYWDDITSQSSIVLGWTQLQNYPSACPSDTYVTQLDDTITCTGISDVYLLNTGDSGIGNYTFTGGTFDTLSLNTGQGDYELYAMDQDVLTTSDVIFDSVSSSIDASNITSGTISSARIADDYLLNTGDIATGNYSFTDEITSIEKISFEADSVNHAISDNSTCVIITGDTSTFNIC